MVVLETLNNAGTSVLIEELGAGKLVGWSWLFPPYIWHFDARAAAPTSALFFYGTILREYCAKDPSLGLELLKRMSQVMVERLQSARARLVANHSHQRNLNSPPKRRRRGRDGLDFSAQRRGPGQPVRESWSESELERSRSGSNLATVLEKKHLGRGILAIIEAKCAVTSDMISAHAATGAAAVHLMNPEPASSIECAPGFHENRPIRLCPEHRFQGRSFHFPVLDHTGHAPALRSPIRRRQRFHSRAVASNGRSVGRRASADRNHRPRASANRC